MRIRVYMKDGRTCYRLASVEVLHALINASPASSDWLGNAAPPEAVDAERAYWNGSTGLWHFEPIRVLSIDRGSIAVVEEDA